MLSQTRSSLETGAISTSAQRVTTGLQRALEQGESLETPLKIEPFVGFEAD
jgi:hypothetical protein